MSRAPNILYVGGVGPRRMAFVSAWRDAIGKRPLCVSYASLAKWPERIAALAAEAHYIRFDSPDRDREALASVLRRGKADAARAGFAVVGDDGVDALMRGAIGSPAQIAYGLAGFTEDVLASSRAPASLAPTDLRASFDKTETHVRFKSAGIPVPEFYGNPSSFEDVRKLLSTQTSARAFLKVRHGSSAAGMMAIVRRGPHWRAITTAFKSASGELCATRDLQTLTNEADIGNLIDALAPLGLHLESWAPKFTLEGAGCDLRIVPQAGDPFIRIRSSRSPMTNLHLGASRQDAAQLKGEVGETNWQAMLDTARRATQAFPSLRTAGLDLAFLSHPRQHVVFEINAFGSFVKDGPDGARTPYLQEAASLAAHFSLQSEAAS